ncbi:MAG: nucleoside-diphosphate kinase [Gammaproteobacteria bacterium]|nr:nucleoside-diphosphate kinase [Gammaproteobacteria bacterium]
MNNITFAIIKPDAVKNKYTGLIYDRIIKAGFEIIGAKLKKITKDEANEFYSIHSDKPFYNELTDFMSSGHSMVLALKKENAVQEWRTTIGATNPDDADQGTIRKDFASSLSENAVHGSDSDENAIKEIKFFFSGLELI